MNAGAAPTKTLRGYEEIRARQHRLSLLARWILIMADGERSIAGLAEALDRDPDGPEFQAAVASLFSGEYLCYADDPPGR